MRTGTIKSSWLLLDPKLRMNAQFWLSVREALEKKSINPDEATAAQVKAAIAEIDAK